MMADVLLKGGVCAVIVQSYSSHLHRNHSTISHYYISYTRSATVHQSLGDVLEY
jgi:hypothetical protein